MSRAWWMGVALAMCCGSAVRSDNAAEGAGATPCAKFAEQYKAYPSEMGNMNFSWAEGFMSGWNGARLSANQPHVNLSLMSVEQESFLRRYCDAHPLRDYLDATLALYFKMASDQHIKPKL